MKLRIVLPLLLVLTQSACSSLFSDEKSGTGSGTTNASGPPPDKIEPDVKQAAQLNFQLGVGYIQRGEYLVAIDRLNKSLEFNANSAEAHNALGVAYEQLNQLQQARKEFDQAVSLDRSLLAARINQARMLCRSPEEAAEGERRLVELASQSDMTSPDGGWLEAAQCARQAGALDRAEGYLRQAMAAAPQAPRAPFELAGLLHEMHRDVEARTQLEQFHARFGETPATLALTARVEDSLGNATASKQAVARLLKRFPDSNEAKSYKTRR